MPECSISHCWFRVLWPCTIITCIIYDNYHEGELPERVLEFLRVTVMPDFSLSALSIEAVTRTSLLANLHNLPRTVTLLNL